MPPPTVGIFEGGAESTSGNFLRGVFQYVKEHAPWRVNLETGRNDEPEEPDLSPSYDGVILSIRKKFQRVWEHASERNIPIVLNVTSMSRLPENGNLVALIRCDNAAVGRAAADFFLRKNFQNFAYAAFSPAALWAAERRTAFSAYLAEKGFTVRCHDIRRRRRSDGSTDALTEWLESLPKPVALFASHDVCARMVLDACVRDGISVPDKVSVLGVDDDTVLCETASPQLSSVRVTHFAAGWRVAELLAAAMAGKYRGKSPEEVFLTVEKIVERESVDASGLREAFALRCRELIEADPLHYPRVKELAVATRVSLRTLETRILEQSGLTARDFIRKTRVERVLRLLRDGGLSVAKTAQLCGFCDARHFRVAYEKVRGETFEG